jgi:CRP-like cAMP-binding protein
VKVLPTVLGDLTHVTATQKQVFFPSGSVLFREGDKAEGAYLILTGEVSTTMESSQKGKLPLGCVEPPAYVALVDSIAGENYSCTGRAVRDTRGVFIPRSELLTSFSNPQSKLELLRALAHEVSGSYKELRVVRDKFVGRSGTRRRKRTAAPDSN